jgi:hypothetical protein
MFLVTGPVTKDVIRRAQQVLSGWSQVHKPNLLRDDVNNNMDTQLYRMKRKGLKIAKRNLLFVVSTRSKNAANSHFRCGGRTRSKEDPGCLACPILCVGR